MRERVQIQSAAMGYNEQLRWGTMNSCDGRGGLTSSILSHASSDAWPASPSNLKSGTSWDATSIPARGTRCGGATCRSARAGSVERITQQRSDSFGEMTCPRFTFTQPRTRKLVQVRHLFCCGCAVLPLSVRLGHLFTHKSSLLAVRSLLRRPKYSPRYCGTMGCCMSASSAGASAAEPVGVQRELGAPLAQPSGQPRTAARAGSRGGLAFSNKPSSAVGDASIQQQRRIRFGIVFPEDTGVAPIHIFVDREKPVEKLIAAACSHAGLKLDKGKLVGSPQRLNLLCDPWALERLHAPARARTHHLRPATLVLLVRHTYHLFARRQYLGRRRDTPRLRN